MSKRSYIQPGTPKFEIEVVGVGYDRYLVRRRVSPWEDFIDPPRWRVEGEFSARKIEEMKEKRGWKELPCLN